MIKHLIDSRNALNTNRFSDIDVIIADASKYQPICFFPFEMPAGFNLGELNNFFGELQGRLKDANDTMQAAGKITNFKCIGYDFFETAGLYYAYAICQDFNDVLTTPLLY